MNNKQMQDYINLAEIFAGDIAGQAAYEWYQGEFDDPAEALSSGALEFTDEEMHTVYCDALMMVVPQHHMHLVGEIATYWQEKYR
jgi:hypothetical protein